MLLNLVILSLCYSPMFVQAEPPLDLATTPLSSSGPVTVKPNMLYVLDDSGSMGWEYMPDWTQDSLGSHPGADFHNDPSYNALAYNPAVRYDPPAFFTSTGLKDTTTYPSQDGMSTAAGANFQSKPNWRQVKNDAYGSISGTNNLETGGSTYRGVEASNPQYTVTIPNEFCTRTDLRDCVAQTIPSVSHPYPARIRWCNSAAVASSATVPAINTCQSVRTGSFTNMRIPIPAPSPGTYEATIRFIQNFNTPRVDRIRVNGNDIMRNSTSTTNNENNLAQWVVDRINQCTSSALGNCDVSGYSATRSGDTVTIYAPGVVTSSPVLSISSGSINFSTTPFSNPLAPSTRVTVDIVPTTTFYPYPGQSTKAATRTDCATALCTYTEEMENYANWYTYYRTRMQMMKTSTSLAFEDVGEDFRMGFMTINTASSKSLDFKDFSGTNKYNWYVKLFDIDPNGGTPLRFALANAGRIYADKYSVSGTFNDPIQYECQQNFTLLTTDGKWNGAAGTKVDGSSMTDQDNDPTEKGKYQGANNTSSDQLADIAKYYRDTDLRTGALSNCIGALGSNVCETTGTSPVLNKKQSMVTFTLGLGVDGTLAYDVDYGPNTPGDFKSIYDGNLKWKTAGSNSEETIDDLWHAAVNGDGRYFSAKQTSELIDQLRQAISLIKVTTGSGAAAATSTLNPVSGDNFAYVASYTSGLWIGNLEKRSIDTITGEISTAALRCVEDVVPETSCAAPSIIQPDGSGGYVCVTAGVTDPASCAQPLVGTECREPVVPSCFGELKNQASRTIYFNRAGSGTIAPLDFNDFTAAQASHYVPADLKARLTQGTSLSSAQEANLSGPNIINYIKGDKTYEKASPLPDNQVFRTRSAVLGDLIDSKPSFIGKPTFNYGDSGYQDFKTAQASRLGTVYVGSNDGMLHAFDSDTLEERWAFVPSVVIPNLWKLADTNYSAKHNYFVNGDLTISDICVATDCSTATASDWKTILVAGLDGGGRGYYALDITDPLNPEVLWEFDPSSAKISINKGDANLGYTFGNPVVTKRDGDNKWVVLFTSGYNNIPDNYDTFYDSAASTAFDPDPYDTDKFFNSGDGKGYLYVVNAATGEKLNTITTGVGSQSAPSGLAKITAFADNAEINNITKYVYGGDLNGSIWRFNINSATNSMIEFAQLKDAIGVAQPITTPPELGEVNNKTVVFVGTGKYLEVTDLDAANFKTQSLYAIKDVAVDGTTGVATPNPRVATNGFIKQTIVPNPDPAKSDERISGTASAVNFATGPGWYIDFPDSGERQNVASQLVLGTLLVPTTVPTASACQPAGYGWFNYLDYRTGLSVIPPSGVVSQRTSAPSVGFNVVYVAGKPKVSNVLSDNPNPTLVEGIPFAGSPTGFQLKRSIWREIVQ